MTGLEKILKHIEDDAAAAAESIVKQAQDEADKMLADAKEDSGKKCADIAERSRNDIQACLSRAESAALLKEKKLILSAKQQIINEVIAKAKESLLELPDKEYFDVIIRMVKKYALGQAGQILFSKADRKRLPEQFEAVLQSALSDTEGATITVSERTGDIDGGFILLYGDVEENCSFDALFFASKETLQDKVYDILFK